MRTAVMRLFLLSSFIDEKIPRGFRQFNVRKIHILNGLNPAHVTF